MSEAATKRERNYQIDFLKLVFAALVFFWHTKSFIGENTRLQIAEGLGWWCVQFFFIVSGFLMVRSYLSSDHSKSAGKAAGDFLLHKAKLLLLPYLVSWAIAAVFYYIFFGAQHVTSLIPEALMVFGSGLGYAVNDVTWYISTMLIVMLPLYYMLHRNPDFFCSVFSPLASVLLMAYFYNTTPYVSKTEWLGFTTGGVLRAVFGICTGVMCHQIYLRIKAVKSSRSKRIILTAAELLLFGTVFAIWLSPESTPKMVYSVMLLLPVAVAIVFTGESYIAQLFKARIFRFAGSLSLALYLNHITGKLIVMGIEDKLPEASYKVCVLLMAAFAVGLCVIYYLVIFACKRLYKAVCGQKRAT